MWEFREYQSETGKCPVSEWYEDLTPGNKARADRFIEIARKLDILELPHFRGFRELLEARWRGENGVPHRMFCYISSDGCVTFLCGFTHKDGRYDPANAYERAERRRNEIQRNEERDNEVKDDEEQEGGASTRELAF